MWHMWDLDTFFPGQQTIRTHRGPKKINYGHHGQIKETCLGPQFILSITAHLFWRLVSRSNSPLLTLNSLAAGIGEWKRQITKASFCFLSASCFSMFFGGLESPIAWNFIVHYPPLPLAGSQALWPWLDHPPRTPSACRHRQQSRQHPHLQHHWRCQQSMLQIIRAASRIIDMFMASPKKSLNFRFEPSHVVSSQFSSQSQVCFGHNFPSYRWVGKDPSWAIALVCVRLSPPYLAACPTSSSLATSKPWKVHSDAEGGPLIFSV